MCCDFGFRTGSARLYQEQYGEVPSNIFQIVSLLCTPACLAAGYCTCSTIHSHLCHGHRCVELRQAASMCCTVM
jgi:hypothetical protein